MSADNLSADALSPMGGAARAVQEATPRAPSRAEERERRREVLAFWGYRAAERLIGWLPRGLVLPMSAAVGNVGYDLGGDKQRVVRENLARAMGLRPADRRVAWAARRAFRNYARYLADVMRLADSSPEQVGRLVDIADIGPLYEAQREGKGVLLCTVHVGGMDLIAPPLHLAGEELNVVADDTTYGRLYEHLKAVRARHGLTLIGWRNLRALFRALHAGQNLVLFCDGGYRPGDVPVDFLGEPTTFPPGPATLSARSGAPMLPVSARRTRGDRFHAEGLPLIRATSTEPREIHRATQQLADALGGVIAADPGQWYMFRPVWPQTDADRARARRALEAARRGEDWSKVAA
ncbi:MAG TPA: lysophospholipid acyltransferase family protein [Candidatus Limnocylindria bacterium]|nr:lysophospholipid acyltransferase family protein [Candidatus Limnocylindria bacterium]